MLSPYASFLKILGVLVLLAVLLFGGFKTYSMGYRTANAEWTIKHERLVSEVRAAEATERNRQVTANEMARRRLDAIISTYNREAEAREDRIKDLTDEAMADRNAARLCLGADSVRRLNHATPGSE